MALALELKAFTEIGKHNNIKNKAIFFTLSPKKVYTKKGHNMLNLVLSFNFYKDFVKVLPVISLS